jgi:hypothetical protein
VFLELATWVLRRIFYLASRGPVFTGPVRHDRIKLGQHVSVHDRKYTIACVVVYRPWSWFSVIHHPKLSACYPPLELILVILSLFGLAPLEDINPRDYRESLLYREPTAAEGRRPSNADLSRTNQQVFVLRINTGSKDSFLQHYSFPSFHRKVKYTRRTLRPRPPPRMALSAGRSTGAESG